MNIILSDDQIVKLCDHLVDSPIGFYDATYKLFGKSYSIDDLCDESFNKIMERVFCCSKCNWWFSTFDDHKVDSSVGRWISHMCRDCKCF